VEKQARLYADPAKQEFFLMNSLRHMVCQVKELSFKETLGVRWLSRHNKLVQQHARAYQQIAWKPVLCLLDPNSPSFPSIHQ